MTDKEFAVSLDGKSIPHWSEDWPRIARLQHAGLLRIKAVTRWVGVAAATDVARSA